MNPHLEKLHAIFEIAQKWLAPYGKIAICGGAVRNALMNEPAKDYDIFLMPKEIERWKEEFDKLKQEICYDFIRWGAIEKIEPIVDWHRSEPFLVDTFKLNHQGEHEIQILITPYRTLNELIDSFDWNICLFGLDENGILAKEDVNNIGEGLELKLNKVTFPLSTLRRGFRFSERFLMKLRKQDINYLCSLIVAKEQFIEYRI